MDLKILTTLMAQAVGITLVSDARGPSQLAAVPDGVNLHSLEAFQDAPNRIAGISTFHRFDDFAGYVNAYKGEGSRIFVDPDLKFGRGGVLATAFMDFPEPGKPAWTTHQARLVVSPALEYQLLTALEGRGLIAQPDFALALRDVSRFCTTLSSADLLEIAQTLTLSSKGEFATIEDNFSGSVRFGYDVQVKATSDTTARKNVEVPREIGFNLPVLLGGRNFDLVAELLYRIPADKADKVKMGIRIPDRAFVERAVLEQQVQELGQATGLVVALGNTNVPTTPADLA